jgi:hypothetical protein
VARKYETVLKKSDLPVRETVPLLEVLKSSSIIRFSNPTFNDVLWVHRHSFTTRERAFRNRYAT